MAAEVNAKISAEISSAINRLKKIEERMRTNSGGGGGGEGGESSQAGMMLTGTDKFRAWYNEDHANSDPGDNVKNLLFEADGIYCYDRMIILRPQGRPRAEATVAIVHFRSIQHKKQVVISLKRYLARCGVRGVGVRDLFPSECKEEVRALNVAGLEIKKNRAVDCFRVINIADRPVLQGQKGQQPYYTIPKEQYEGYIHMESNTEVNMEMESGSGGGSGNSGAGGIGGGGALGPRPPRP